MCNVSFIMLTVLCPYTWGKINFYRKHTLWRFEYSSLFFFLGNPHLNSEKLVFLHGLGKNYFV